LCTSSCEAIHHFTQKALEESEVSELERSKEDLADDLAEAPSDDGGPSYSGLLVKCSKNLLKMGKKMDVGSSYKRSMFQANHKLRRKIASVAEEIVDIYPRFSKYMVCLLIMKVWVLLTNVL
jgi:hypothetical protein